MATPRSTYLKARSFGQISTVYIVLSPCLVLTLNRSIQIDGTLSNLVLGNTCPLEEGLVLVWARIRHW